MEKITKLNDEELEIEITLKEKRKIKKSDLLVNKTKIDNLLKYFD